MTTLTNEDLEAISASANLIATWLVAGVFDNTPKSMINDLTDRIEQHKITGPMSVDAAARIFSKALARPLTEEESAFFSFIRLHKVMSDVPSS